MAHLIVVLIVTTALTILHVSALIQSPPKITKQPPTNELLFQVAQAKDYENDRPFLIECEASGEPEPMYRWEKNGKRFEWQAYDNRISQQNGRGTLVIASPRDEDLGQYQCIAANEWGTAISNSVFVRKAELNSFKDELPRTENATEGDPFKLTCQPPDGWPKPKVNWLILYTSGGIKSINNSRMTLDPEGNLWFSNVTRNDASDDFWYTCAASSVFRNEYKLGDHVLLNVLSTEASSSNNKHEPVKQYVSRENEVALLGKRIELYCIYGGTPLPQTVWNKDGQVLQANDRITQGNYGKSLIIKHVTFADAGAYTCEISNGVGDAKSYSISLRVEAIPYFTHEPEIENKADGETAIFRCEASGVPQPQIKWIHNGKPIEETPPNPRRKVTDNMIIIEKLVKKDTGNYGCNATNSLGYVYKDVYVNVLAIAPQITQPPSNQATVDGKTILITCRVFGAPKPEVKWFRNSVELTGGKYKTLDSGDLEIKDVSFVDVGTYTCYATNKFGHNNASADLEVKQHTTITDGPEDYEVAAGSTATFRCRAMADSSLLMNINWLSNGEEIDFDMEPRFIRTPDYSLIITKTTDLDSGTYTCVARTELDEVKAEATLTVQDVPNAPRLEGVQCGNEEATIHWVPMGDNKAPILRYTIESNTGVKNDTWKVLIDDVLPTERTYTMRLTPYANNTFRVLASNKLGVSLPSQFSEVCTTPPDVPYTNPTNVRAAGTNPHNMVIRWTIVPRAEHNGPGFKYRVFYKPDIDGAEWTIVDINKWKMHKLQIDNLPTYQRYKIKIVALNNLGESRIAANEVFGYSGEDVPQQAPGNFTLLNVIGSTSALFSWNPVPEESIRGKFLGYKIQAWTNNSADEDITEVHVSKNSTSCLFQRLVPFSRNYVRIFVYNKRYHGPPSDSLSLETPEGVPGMVQSLDAIPLGYDALNITWSKPEHPNGILTGYRIYYEVVSGFSLGPTLEMRPSITDPEATSAELRGLTPSTTYRIHIRATTSAGEGEQLFIERSTGSPDSDDYYD